MVFSLAALPSAPITLYLPKKCPNLHSRKLSKMSPIQCSLSVSTQSKTPQFDLKPYRTILIQEMNQKPDQAIPIEYPDKIYEAMRYSVLAKGAKRAPPVMCVASCELFGGNRLAAFPTACALEMLRDLIDFLPASPSPAAIVSSIDSEIKEILAAAGFDFQSCSSGGLRRRDQAVYHKNRSLFLYNCPESNSL